MERKYYLRGLGIGIAVTAIIMGISSSRNKTMTDAEIIARAKELGMVENTVLSDTEDEDGQEMDVGREEDQRDVANTPTDAEEAVSDVTDQGNDEDQIQEPEDAEEAVDQDTAEEENDENDLDSEPEGQPDIVADEDIEADAEADSSEPEEPGEITTPAAIKTITINSGDGSRTVANKLADVGAVSSAESFDAFLCQNGYDKKLRTGTFSIPENASEDQLARIVTGSE